eukprot:641169-Lingulodinium_polyedra.AAC.1
MSGLARDAWFRDNACFGRSACFGATSTRGLTPGSGLVASDSPVDLPAGNALGPACSPEKRYIRFSVNASIC